jgi:heat shock protein HslJ
MKASCLVKIILRKHIPIMTMKLFLIGLVSLLSACATEKNSVAKPSVATKQTTSTSTNELTNTTWLLETRLDETDQPSQSMAESPIHLSFNSQQLSGYAGCNNYFAQYQISDAQNLKLTGPIGSSLKACSPAINQQEKTYLSLLPQVTYFKLENDRLLLLDQNKKTLLTFAAQNSAQVLENTNWQATGINNNHGGVVSDKNTHLSTAHFSNGEIQGKAACNQFSARYTLQNQQITFGPARTTRMFCSEEGVMAQEAQFLYALTQINRYEVTANKLSIRLTLAQL